MPRRLESVAELIRRELSVIILKKEEVIITLTRVELSYDTQYADVYFTSFPDEGSKKTLQDLNRDVFSMQQDLNKRLRMRPVPKIRFHIDRMEEEAVKIDELLKRI